MDSLVASSRLLALYRSAGYLALPALDLLLARRTRQGKEDPTRRKERYGIASHPRPQGPLVWVHAASVGETNSALPVIRQITARGISVLMTSGTLTSAQVAGDCLPQGAFHQYVPFDVDPYVRRFLDTWQPDLALFVESEIWPLTLSELGERSVPVVTLNGRISPRSASHWRRVKGFSDQVFSNIDLCLAQSESDAATFAGLGVVHAKATGNLKFDREPLAFDAAALEGLQQAVGERLAWIAASTHPGEEDLALATHRVVLQRAPDALLIVAPRHPKRGGEVVEAARRAGLGVAVRSRGEVPDASSAVYVADTIGDLGLLYRLAALAFVGGSFAERGGQNPVEPAQLGVPVVHGPRVRNFKGIYKELNEVGGAVLCQTEAIFKTRVTELLFDAAQRSTLADNAKCYVASQSGALERTLRALTPFLEPLAERATGDREAI